MIVRTWLISPFAIFAAIASAEAAAEPAVGTEFFYSSDSDETEVVRAAVDFDLRDADEDRYVGLRLEKAWYHPEGEAGEERERVFIRAGDTMGKWQWQARVGTDGDSVIGSISAHDDAPFRKELFIERDIIETRQSLDRGIYTTFAGAAVDVPIDERNVLTALVGYQTFTGDNNRLHLRGNYVHVVQPETGLSVQLRGRWFRSSDPGEFDYYSPGWYAEILPVAQVRRFVGGWELVGAAGLGLQRDSASDWRQSRYAHARVRSPETGAWSLNGAFTYTNNPAVTAAADGGYSYVQFSLGVSRTL